jgi:DMSO/TMAO reductase YedYZ molybdopterin-dependent catalytic subunit
MARAQIHAIPELDAQSAAQAAARAGLVVRREEPLNAEVPPAALDGELTPPGQFFLRNHFPIPELRAADWRLRVGGLVGEPLELSLDELTSLGRVCSVSTLECAGNGRIRFGPAAHGERWAEGAVGSAWWAGVPLGRVLRRAGILPGACEVVFRGADAGQVEDRGEPVRFERSLPVADALGSGALLAYEMNGAPLPVRHGHPVRLVVPGWYAVASVKWLTDIDVTGEPFTGYFQDEHYVYEWPRGGALAREPVRLQRVRSLVTEPGGGSWRPAGDLAVRGVAWSGSAPVNRVEVAIGDGPWREAELATRPPDHGWRRWALTVTDVPPGLTRIRSRAYDRAGHDQLTAPEWNRRGYGGNFVHEVPVRLY